MSESRRPIPLVVHDISNNSSALTANAPGNKITSMLCSLDFLAAAASLQLWKEENTKVLNHSNECSKSLGTKESTERLLYDKILTDQSKTSDYSLPPISEIMNNNNLPKKHEKPASNTNTPCIYQSTSLSNSYKSDLFVQHYGPSSVVTSLKKPLDFLEKPKSERYETKSEINTSEINTSLSLDTQKSKVLQCYNGREGPYQRRKRLNQNYKYRETLMAQGIYPLHQADSTYVCSLCGESFRKEMFMWRHGVKHLNSKPFKCEVCDSTFNRSDTLARHVRCFHESHN